MPVVPITPGAIALTSLIPSLTSSGFIKNICLVTITLSITNGPKESGVTLIFPSPTTNPRCLLVIPSTLNISLIIEVKTFSHLSKSS